MKKMAIITIGMALLLACQGYGEILYRATFGYLLSNNPQSPDPQYVEGESLENWRTISSTSGLIYPYYESNDVFQTQSHGRFSLYLKDPDSTTNYAMATSPLFINDADEYMIEFWFYVPEGGVAFNEGFPVLTPLNVNGPDTNGTDLKLWLVPIKSTPAYLEVWASNLTESAVIGRLDSTDRWYKLQLHRYGSSVDVFLMSELKATLNAASGLKTNLLRIGTTDAGIQGEAYWDDFIVTTVPQGNHPRLFFDQAGIEMLRQRAQDNSMTVLGKSYKQIFNEDIGAQATWWAEDPYLHSRATFSLHGVKWVYPFYQPPRRSNTGFPAWTEAGQNSFPERIENMAIAAVVLDSMKYYDYMRPILRAFSTWQQWTDPDFRHPYYMYNCLDGGHFTQIIALAFDLMFNHLNNYEKMNAQNAILTLGLQPLNCQFFIAERGEGADFWAVTRSGLSIGSLVLDPPNMYYLGNSRQIMEDKLICNPTIFDPNGQTAQSTVYGYYTAAMATKWVEAVTRANIGYPNYYNYPFYCNYADSRAKWHPIRGSKAYQPIFTQDYGRDMLGNDPSSVYLIASRKHNEYAQYVASKWPWPSTCEFIPWCRFVWFDASVDTVRPNESLGWGVEYRDAGYTAMRTDWTDNGFSLFFKSGPRASGHDHSDKNSFVMLGKYGWLLKDYSTWGGAASRHSTILVDGEGQVGFYQYENSYLRRGYIEKYYSDSRYSYSSGRAESVYVYQQNSNYYNKLDLFRRELLHDNDQKILLLNDNIKTAGSLERNIDWLLAVSNVEVFSDSVAIWLNDDTLWCRIISPQNVAMQHIQETNTSNTVEPVFNSIKVDPNPLDTPVVSARYLAVFFRHDPANPGREVISVAGHKINGVNADNSYILYADSLNYLESAYYTTRALDSVENVVAGLEKNKYYRIVVQDTTTKHALAIIDTTTTDGGTLRFVFNASENPCKVFITSDNAVPTGSLTLSSGHTNFRFVKLTAEASYPYAAIDDYCVIQKHWEPLNNDTLSEYGQWVEESTGWVPYSRESVFRLANSQRNRPNIFTVQYRVLDKVYSQTYEKSVYYNDVPPTQGQMVINSGASYTNNRLVNVLISGADYHPGLGKMRFDEKPLGVDAGYVNVVGNGTFGDTTGWILGNAVVEDGFLHLLGSYHGGPSPWQDSSVAIQVMPGTALSDLQGKLMRLGESMYVGNAVCCGKTAAIVFEDSASPWTQVLVNRTYANGGFNEAAWDTFTLPVTVRPFHVELRYWIPGMTTPPPPPPPPHDPKFNSLAIDNVRLEPIEIRYGANPSDPVLPPYPYVYDGWRQVDTANASTYQLTEGEGPKQINTQLMDLCGNVSSEPGWYDGITLDLSLPWTTIHSPQNGANISADTFSLAGC